MAKRSSGLSINGMIFVVCIRILLCRRLLLGLDAMSVEAQRAILTDKLNLAEKNIQMWKKRKDIVSERLTRISTFRGMLSSLNIISSYCSIENARSPSSFAASSARNDFGDDEESTDDDADISILTPLKVSCLIEAHVHRLVIQPSLGCYYGR